MIEACTGKLGLGLCLRCLTPISTIFQLYRGGQFYLLVETGENHRILQVTNKLYHIRDRPFNLKGGGGGGGLWFFVSFRIFFSDNTRVRILIFFCRAKRKFFFQNLTLGYMTKTLNQIIFFSSTKIRIFFSATLGIRIYFLEKNHNPPPPPPPPPPLQVKWLFPNVVSSTPRHEWD